MCDLYEHFKTYYSIYITSYFGNAEGQEPDEVNCNVHETLASNHGSRHGDNPLRKPLSIFKISTRESLKTFYFRF